MFESDDGQDDLMPRSTGTCESGAAASGAYKLRKASTTGKSAGSNSVASSDDTSTHRRR